MRSTCRALFPCVNPAGKRQVTSNPANHQRAGLPITERRAATTAVLVVDGAGDMLSTNSRAC
jgi:hypothetical protein